jgi:hypothetical protein
MNPSQIYIAIAVVSFIAIVFMLFIGTKKSKNKRLSKLASSAFAFIIAGIVFGENRLIGYSLIGIGVILAVVDMCMKFKDRE